MNKRILLLDTSFSAKPIYDYLVRTGSEVYVVGGNTDDALAKSVKNYININYSKIDKVKSLIKKLSIDFLVPGGNDFSYRVCSEINEDLSFYNIDSIEVTDTLNNKEKFRKFSQEINLHVPRIVELDQITDFLPVIIKPVDAYSGHGMTVIYKENQNDIKSAINLALEYSKTGNYLIEEFITGQLYSHSAFIVDGNIKLDFIVEEHCTINQYVVDTSRVIFDFPDQILDKLRNDITALVKNLNLPDGLVHTQLISDGNSFWLIEVTRRCPGDLYSKLIEYSTGFPYAEYYARPFIDETRNISDIRLNRYMVMRHTITLKNPAPLNSIKFNYPISMLRYVPLSLTGDKLKESPFSRVGIIFSLSNSELEFINVWNKTLSKSLYTLD